MSITSYQSNRVLDYNFGATSYTTPATLYVGLSTTPINFDGTGATEPVALGYARVAVTNNKTNWSTAASGILSNLTAIQFPESTGSWGTITHVAVYDAASAGNMLYFEALTSSRAVPTLTTVLFAAAGFVVQMNNT